MRCPLTICLLLLFPFIKAQNNLQLTSLQGIPANIYINDSLVNTTAQANLLIEGLKRDTIVLKAILGNKATTTQTVYLLDKGKPVSGMEFSYMLEQKNAGLRFTFAGVSKIVRMPSPIVPPKPVEDTSYKYRNNILGHYCELKEGRVYYFNNMPPDEVCKTPMPESYLGYMGLLMLKAQIEDDKFKIAENTTRNNCISVAQLVKILSYISYEIEKLKMVRLSFFHLSDPENKSRLSAAFKLESSKKELEDFFKNSHEYKYKAGGHCTVPAKETELDGIYKQISVYNTDPEKLAMLKKTYMDYCYSVNQVKTLLGLFVHDREKTDAAKMLYFYCTDKANFMEIESVFSYASSVSEMNEFVQKQKN